MTRPAGGQVGHSVEAPDELDELNGTRSGERAEANNELGKSRAATVWVRRRAGPTKLCW